MADVKAYKERPEVLKRKPSCVIEFFDVEEDGEGNPLPYGGMGLHVAYYNPEGKDVSDMTKEEFEDFKPTESHHACHAAYKFIRMIMDNGGSIPDMPKNVHTIQADENTTMDDIMGQIKDVLEDEMSEDEIDQFLRENGINTDKSTTKH